MSMHGRVVALAESLNRFRSLSDEETDWLEYSLRLEAQTEGRSRNRTAGKNFWNDDIDKLTQMLADGQSPAQIATALGRSRPAVFEKMYKMGLRVTEAAQ